eukprot:gene7901-8716_t
MSMWDQYFAIRYQFGDHTNETVSSGRPYKQLFHYYPELNSYYSDWEKSFDPIPVYDLMERNSYIIPVLSILAYGLFIFLGQRVMKDRKPFNLTHSLAVWNLFLSLFSLYGAVRTVPHILHRLATVSFEETVCETPYTAYGAGACGLASLLFIWSKIPELVDTVFIVLRKKPLIFLHWYHHITVLVFCWNSYVTMSGAGLYFIAMNYTVHAVMYFYYCLQALKKVPKWFPSWIITLLQISQMLVGTAIVAASYYYYIFGGQRYAPGECNNKVSNLIAGGVIYGSYFYLFVEFALKRFIFAEKKSKEVKKTN